MRIAVTGASGFIGRQLVSELGKQHHELRLLVHREEMKEAGEKHSASLNDPKALRNFLEGVEAVYHLASVLGGRGLPAREYYAVNRDGTRSLLEAAVSVGVRKVVHFSSAGVYGKTSGLVPLKETDPLHPSDPYEKSKREGEAVALSFADRLDVSVIRPGWVYGEGDNRTFKLIRRIHVGPFFIVGPGKVRHAAIHVSDVVRLALRVCKKGKRGGIYNSGGENLAVEEIIRTIDRSLGKNRDFFHLPMGLVLPAAMGIHSLFRLLGREAPLTPAMLAFFRRGKPLDGGLAERELKFHPQVAFAEGMNRAVKWYRQNGWL